MKSFTQKLINAAAMLLLGTATGCLPVIHAENQYAPEDTNASFTMTPVFELYDTNGKTVKKGSFSDIYDEIDEVNLSGSVDLANGKRPICKSFALQWKEGKDTAEHSFVIPDGYDYAPDDDEKNKDLPVFTFNPYDFKILGKKGQRYYYSIKGNTSFAAEVPLTRNGYDTAAQTVIKLFPYEKNYIPDTFSAQFENQTVKRGETDNLIIRIRIPEVEIDDETKEIIKADNNSEGTHIPFIPAFGVSVDSFPGFKEIPTPYETDSIEYYFFEEDKSENQKKAEAFIRTWKAFIEDKELSAKQTKAVFNQYTYAVECSENAMSRYCGPLIDLYWLNQNGYAGKTLKISIPYQIQKDTTIEVYIHSNGAFDRYYEKKNAVSTSSGLIPTSDASLMKQTERWHTTASTSIQLPSIVVTPQVKKIINGDKPAEKAEFTIDVRKKGDDTPLFSTTVQGEETKTIATLELMNPGIFTYVVKERNDHLAGYIYDENEYLIQYTVKKQNDRLTVDKSVIKEGSVISHDDIVIITNTYRKQPPQPITAIPSIQKTISGAVPSSKETYQFKITPEKSSSPMPEKDTLSITGSGTASFGNIYFRQAESYQYTVSEIPGTNASCIYDDNTYQITYDVTEDNGKLQLHTAITSNDKAVDEIIFNNVYSTSSYVPYERIEADFPTVIKKITGITESKDTFRFKIDSSDDAPLPENREISIAGEGTASFGKAIFTRPGTYTYTIQEIQDDSNNHYTCDSSTYVLTCTVKSNNGSLRIDQQITRDDQKVDQVVFTNAYHAQSSLRYIPIHDTIEIQKVITGTTPAKPEKFEFELIPSDKNNPMPSVSIITIEGQGAASFEDIRFDKPGEYIYTLHEVNNQKPGYSYDNAVYTIYYDVQEYYEANEGALCLMKVVQKNQESLPDAIVFTNQYIVSETAQTGLKPDRKIFEAAALIAAGISLLCGIAANKIKENR